MSKKIMFISIIIISIVSGLYAGNTFMTDPNRGIQKTMPVTTFSYSYAEPLQNEDTIYYDGPNSNNGIGLTNGGTFYGAVRFTAVDGCTLKSAIFFQYQAVSASGWVYVHAAGTSSAPGAKLDSAPYNNAPGTWVRVNFPTPRYFPAGTDFWLNVKITHTAGTYPFGIDAGPSVTPPRSYVSLDGTTWQTLVYYNLNYNWNLRAIGRFVRFANDVGVDEILSPGATHRVNTPMTPSARVKNYGTSTQTNFSVTCTILGSGGVLRYTNTQTVASLASNATTNVNFTSWTPTIEEQVTVIMRTLLSGDQNPGNDRKTRNTQIAQTFLSEGFNDPTFPPSGWQAVIINGTYNWQRYTTGSYPTCTPYEGEGMAGYASWYASSGSQARLISPAITPGAPTQCTLKFYMMHDPGYSTVQESVIVEVSLDGTTFNRVAAFRRYEPTQGWQEHTVYLGNFSSTFYVGFRALSGYGNNMYIDFVRVTGAA
ncbi:MAG: hypothetical protein NZ601_01035, partial [candidate division WOR-3 bacterium]|nr:hypothetical protein [candidate division WOR-3 bacterium]MCX7757272.1 hypothetical protein [candidate division WOR-3 bacterium]